MACSKSSSKVDIQRGHCYLERLTDGSILLRDPSTDVKYSYSVDQLKAYHAFDRELRNGKVNGTSTVPGGYPGFQQMWNEDPDCAWGFTEWDDEQFKVVLHGAAVPYRLLIPHTEEKPERTNDEFLHRLAILTAKRAVVQADFQERKKQDRLRQKRSFAQTGLLGQPSSSSRNKRARTYRHRSAPEYGEDDAEGEVYDEQEEREAEEQDGGEANHEAIATTATEEDETMRA
ncbi:hypothetical protein BC835DRAFT_1307452 [Cytidiella melzeri]|nr:hypothetical protein BC835DRAFT_1307452 [Cytidiella melzeri]